MDVHREGGFYDEHKAGGEKHLGGKTKEKTHIVREEGVGPGCQSGGYVHQETERKHEFGEKETVGEKIKDKVDAGARKIGLKK